MAELSAEKRNIFGKKTRDLRVNGFIPAELYGHGIENTHLSVSRDAFARVYREAGEHAIVSVRVDGEARPVLVHGVQVHPVTGEVLSVDFYQVRMDEKVTTHVPLEFVGASPAAEEKDGVLVRAMTEIEVEALPANIPEKIEADLSQLTELGETIYVKDLPKSDVYEIAVDPETAVVSVSEPKEEEEPEEELTPEDVIVEGEEKREKEAGEEGERQGEGNKEKRDEK